MEYINAYDVISVFLYLMNKMRWNLISMRRVIFRWLNLVVEYINADEKIHFCLHLMNKMQTNFINVIMQVLFPVAFIVLHCFFFQFRFTDS